MEWSTVINVYVPPKKHRLQSVSRGRHSTDRGGSGGAGGGAEDDDEGAPSSMEYHHHDVEMQAMMRALSVVHESQTRRQQQRQLSKHSHRGEHKKSYAPGTQAMKNQKFWLLLCDAQFRTAMRFRRRYPSLMRVMLFYFQHLKDGVIYADINHQEMVLESLEQHFEGLKARMPQQAQSSLRVFGGNQWFLDVCIFCHETFTLLYRAYRIEKYVEEIEISDHEFTRTGLRQDRIVRPPSLVESHDYHDKKRLIAIVRPNDAVVSQHYRDWWQSQKRRHIQEPTDHQIKHEMICQMLTHQLRRWDRKNRSSLLLRSHGHNVIFSSEYDLSGIDVVYTEQGFTRDNFLRFATGKIKRRAVYALFVQNQLQ